MRERLDVLLPTSSPGCLGHFVGDEISYPVKSGRDYETETMTFLDPVID